MPIICDASEFSFSLGKVHQNTATEEQQKQSSSSSKKKTNNNTTNNQVPANFVDAVSAPFIACSMLDSIDGRKRQTTTKSENPEMPTSSFLRDSEYKNPFYRIFFFAF